LSVNSGRLLTITVAAIVTSVKERVCPLSRQSRRRSPAFLAISGVEGQAVQKRPGLAFFTGAQPSVNLGDVDRTTTQQVALTYDVLQVLGAAASSVQMIEDARSSGPTAHLISPVQASQQTANVRPFARMNVSDA